MEPLIRDTTSPTKVLKVLEALKQASHDLHSHCLTRPTTSGEGGGGGGDPTTTSSSASTAAAAIKALLELETESDTILSRDPHLKTLSQHLTNLKSLYETLKTSTNFLTRRVSAFSISRAAASIEAEIQAWIDREGVENLSGFLKNPAFYADGDQEKENELVGLLNWFENRVSMGFDRGLQNLVLKVRVFSGLEQVLCEPNVCISVREHCASCVSGLVKFNKDVFVGQVVMSRLVRALVLMGSSKSMEVLCSLIKSIKSPFVDEIESNGEIPKIISFLDYHKDLEFRVLTMDCILTIGYFGRKEAVDAMLAEGLVEKLVELQRSELGGDLIELGKFDCNNIHNGDEDGERNRESKSQKKRRFLETHPFTSCVARFAIQLEVGEGLRQREKRAFKLEILQRVREASVSDAEAATMVSEVLWGSSL